MANTLHQGKRRFNGGLFSLNFYEILSVLHTDLIQCFDFINMKLGSNIFVIQVI